MLVARAGRLSLPERPTCRQQLALRGIDRVLHLSTICGQYLNEKGEIWHLDFNALVFESIKAVSQWHDVQHFTTPSNVVQEQEQVSQRHLVLE